MDNIYSIPMKWFWFNFETKFETKWKGTCLYFNRSWLKANFSKDRINRFKFESLGNGYHLSYFMNKEKMNKKLNSFSHSKDLRIRFFKKSLFYYVFIYRINPFKPFLHKENLLNIVNSEETNYEIKEAFNNLQFKTNLSINFFRLIYFPLKLILFEILIWFPYRVYNKIIVFFSRKVAGSR